MVEDDGVEVAAVVVGNEVFSGVGALQAARSDALVLQQRLVQGKQHLQGEMRRGRRGEEEGSLCTSTFSLFQRCIGRNSTWCERKKCEHSQCSTLKKTQLTSNVTCAHNESLYFQGAAEMFIIIIPATGYSAFSFVRGGVFSYSSHTGEGRPQDCVAELPHRKGGGGEEEEEKEEKEKIIRLSPPCARPAGRKFCNDY